MSDPMPRVMSLREIERRIEPEGRESRKRRLDPLQQSKPTAPSQFFSPQWVPATHWRKKEFRLRNRRRADSAASVVWARSRQGQVGPATAVTPRAACPRAHGILSWRITWPSRRQLLRLPRVRRRWQAHGAWKAEDSALRVLAQRLGPRVQQPQRLDTLAKE
jgi:hypothetical protein